MSGGVFVCYRRGDTAGFAGRIYDRLAKRLGRDNVFIDVDNIQPGLDFVEVLSERVGKCDALVAVIGRDWVSSAGSDNRRRIDDPQDFVRIEIEAALERSVRVIPVLVDGAKMPRPEELPDSLKKLARRQGIDISHTQFESDVRKLTRALSLLEAELRQHAETERAAREEREKREAAADAEKAAEARRLADAEAARRAEEERRAEDSAEAERATLEQRKKREAAEAAEKADQARRLAEAEAQRVDEERRVREAAEAERAAKEEKKRREAAEAAEKAEQARRLAEAEAKRADEERRTREAAEAERAAKREQKRREAAEAAEKAERARRLAQAEAQRADEERRAREADEAERVAKVKQKRRELAEAEEQGRSKTQTEAAASAIEHEAARVAGRTGRSILEWMPDQRVSDLSEGAGASPTSAALEKKRQNWLWPVLALVGVALALAVATILMVQKPQGLAVNHPPAQEVAPRTPSNIPQGAQPPPTGDQSALAPEIQPQPSPSPGQVRASDGQTGPRAAEPAQPTVGEASPANRPEEAHPEGTLPTAARAAMLIASADNPQKPVVNLGSTVWSTIPAPQDRPSGVAVQADADIPDLKMHASMIFQKNTDPTLQATHTIDLKFTFQEGAPFKGFKDVGLPQARKLDSPASETMSAVKVKISDDYFLFALAKGDQDAARNLDLMQTRAWFDFPLLLNDGRIAKLVFQKSVEGEQMLEKTLKIWR